MISNVVYLEYEPLDSQIILFIRIIIINQSVKLQKLLLLVLQPILFLFSFPPFKYDLQYSMVTGMISV